VRWVDENPNKMQIWEGGEKKTNPGQRTEGKKRPGCHSKERKVLRRDESLQRTLPSPVRRDPLPALCSTMKAQEGCSAAAWPPATFKGESFSEVHSYLYELKQKKKK